MTNQEALEWAITHGAVVRFAAHPTDDGGQHEVVRISVHGPDGESVISRTRPLGNDRVAEMASAVIEIRAEYEEAERPVRPRLAVVGG